MPLVGIVRQGKAFMKQTLLPPACAIGAQWQSNLKKKKLPVVPEVWVHLTAKQHFFFDTYFSSCHQLS
jgi:hypothetical protein